MPMGERWCPGFTITKSQSVLKPVLKPVHRLFTTKGKSQPTGYYGYKKVKKCHYVANTKHEKKSARPSTRRRKSARHLYQDDKKCEQVVKYKEVCYVPGKVPFPVNTPAFDVKVPRPVTCRCQR
jgi:hypothetical protein